MSGLRSALRQESQPVSAQAFASGRVLGRDILVIVLAGLLINALLIAIPGFYSHDELDWRTMISQGRSDWSFGLGSFTQSPFFRLLGTIVISASLRLPVQPVGAHFVETTIGIASACFLYRAVSLFRPDRALASAILFMAMPGFAFDVGWVGAGFDVQFTFWGVISVLCGILYWRGGRPWLLAASAVAFAAAMGCKETAMAIPICAAIVMWVDYKNVDRRRAGWLIGVIAVVVVLYFGLNAKRLIFTSAAGSGGYALGDRWLFLRHIAPYFGFPFAYKMPEISNFPIGDAGAAFLLCLPHILLVAVILLRAGPKWAVIYILAFYATLLPVLPISKFETQYGYAPSIALAIALAVTWSRRLIVGIPITALAAILVFHAFFIQKAMYETGACQTRAVDTLRSSVQSAMTFDNPVILVSDDAPWWILVRVTVNRIFVANHMLTASVTKDAAKANMAFHPDCSVTLKN
jgi:hypothetical protein